MRANLLGLALWTLACNVALPSDPLPQMNPEIAGTWSGQATMVLTGLPPIPPRTIQVSVAIDGPYLSLAGLCLDGGGSIFNALGEGNSATWHGPMPCSPNTLDWCPQARVQYDAVDVTLAADGLHVTASGTVSACGESAVMSDTFIGVR